MEMLKSNFINNAVKSLGMSTDNKQLFNNITGSFLIKGTSLFISLFTMPAYLQYFEDERILGIWFTIVSILNWILTFDLGVGNGLRNNLVKAIYENDMSTAKKYISSAYIIIGLISSVIIFIGYFFIGFLDWNTILNVSSTIVTNKVLILTVRWVFIGIICQFFLKLVLSILNAMQKTALANSLALISSILLLIYITSFSAQDLSSNLISLAIVNVLTINLPLVIATLIVFQTSLKKSKPSIKSFEKRYAFDVMKLGGEFFWVQIAFMIISSTDQVMITNLYGPKFVVEYQMYYKIFWVYVSIFTLFTNPVWSAITKAFAEKRIKWIYKVHKLLLKAASILIILCLGTVLILQFVFNFWLGINSIDVNYLYAFIFSINASVIILVMSESAIANGIGILKAQLYCYTLAAFLKVLLTTLLSLFIKDWIVVIVVNIVVLIPYLAIQQPITKKYLKKIEKDSVVL